MSCRYWSVKRTNGVRLCLGCRDIRVSTSRYLKHVFEHAGGHVMTTIATCAVVGGGISGIAAAHYLRSAGIHVELLERHRTPGGRMLSATLDGCRIDLGGKNIGRRYLRFRRLAHELGPFAFEPFGINTSRIRDGKIVTLDSTRRLGSTLAYLRGCPPADALRLAGLCSRVWLDARNRFLDGPSFEKLSHQSDDSPLTAYFSPVFCRAVVRAMSVRMNGAEPDEIHLGNFGTHLGMWLDTYDQLKDGMGAFVSAAVAPLHIRCDTSVERVMVRNGRVSGLLLRHADGRTSNMECERVVLATPAGVSAELLREHDAILAAALDEIRYFPVLVVVAAYRRPIFSATVRGLSFGPDNELSNAGAYGIERLDIVRYTFSGRKARTLIESARGVDGISGPQTEALLDLAEATLRRYIPVERADRRDAIAHLFDPGLCAYAPHHYRLRALLDDRCHGVDGLAFAGDYLRGASIEACMFAAQEAAARIAQSVPEGKRRPSRHTGYGYHPST
ncbi:protoporphyrinogen/coproporphyrinogen oxidase [Pandoraea sp. NPDC087047]|uniref:protoporphyrinogen/coproporphyrinogen oxidase n=1 Tax=Pandoraea sp. NPDC087047 TaxID=3364390 RepID=UPI0038061708